MSCSPGDRDAAVQLDRLTGDRGEGLAGGEPARAAELAVGSAMASPTTARADCTATYRSAIRCFNAWKLPIGRPNCTLSLGVVDGEFQTAARGTDLFGRQQNGGGIRDAGVGADRLGGAGVTRASRRVGSTVLTASALTSFQRTSRASSTAITTSAMSPLMT